jgi:hypothetical protein
MHPPPFIMDTLSKTLIRATKDMKKARWTFDGAVKGKASKNDQEDLWATYMTLRRHTDAIERHMGRVAAAQAEVDKARWWLEHGVHKDTSLKFMFPFDSPRIAKLRREHAVAQADNDLQEACKKVEELLASTTFSAIADPWLDQERARTSAAAAVVAAKEESEKLQAWCEEYLRREEDHYEQAPGQQGHVERTVAECNQTIRQIKAAVSSRPR